jgi:pyruvate/2-oxoacid:ferredoxin oxidoreductase alpha subunit
MGLGAVHAGVRLYAGYPMTPSSPLLSFISEYLLGRYFDANADGHDPSNLQLAKTLATQVQDRIACGILYQREDVPHFYDSPI